MTKSCSILENKYGKPECKGLTRSFYASPCEEKMSQKIFQILFEVQKLRKEYNLV